ncbi:SafA/ExsA family spore coat assembly protein [Cytobacillus gottheilii]|uniref:SafA/ExsA family spore coat assembly protein n=1 Tax=Cytobacillus gottheilii TaxID=859144 RepID=UPI001FE87096|nr:SafA/ExsA family spore coat assembly protein [Cytobacillus gottheilii]
MKIHIVQKGDTLWKIAKKYGVNFEELKKMNTQLSNPDMIMPGMKIKVPASGGTIKKEAPIGPEIHMGSKKEMPKAEHPFAKEKPITQPVAETPKEMPVQPQKPAPLKQEKPKKPYMPKMPKPMMPDIDINNYYLMNLANIQTQQPAPHPQPKPMPQPKPVQQKPVAQPKPVQPKPVEQTKPIEQVKPVKPVMPMAAEQPIAAPTKPKLPPKPLNLFPQENPVEMHESMNLPTNQGGYEQPMNPYHNQNPFYPGAPAPQAGHQGGFPQAQMPYPQVQGVQSPYGMMPGVESPNYEESSPYMSQHQLPLSPSQAQMPAPVMGVEDYGQQLPLQPTYTAPAYQQPYYPCPPTQIYPISPVMPGPGPGYCPPPMHHGYPQYAPMPQVQGVMEEPNYAQMPLMPTESQMPLSPAQHQMPLMPSQSQMPLMPTAVQGAEADCGCGGGAPAGYPHQYQQPFVPAPAFPGAVPYGQPYGAFPQGQMNPYGYGPMGGPAFGRPFDESSDFEG